MSHSIRITILAFLLCGTFLPLLVHAEDVLVFHFERINGELRFDSQISQPITEVDDPNFSIVEFAQRKPIGEYRIDFIDVTGAVSVQSWFDGEDGSFSFVAPHFGIIQKFQIYSTKDGALLLESSLDQFVKCNANSICEFENGENFNTCLADCVSGKFSPITLTLLKQNNNVIRDPKTGAILLQGPVVVATTATDTASTNGTQRFTLLVLGAFIVIIGIFVGTLFLLRRRNRRYGL